MRWFRFRSHDHSGGTGTAAPRSILKGMLVEFPNSDALLEGCRKVRDAGYRKWDAHSPYPIHGIEKAMGVPTTRIPYLIIACGITGMLTGLGLTWWTNASNPKDFLVLSQYGLGFLLGYDFLISGKPMWSLAANIPVIFELTILFSAFGAVFGMLGINGLPNLYHWLFRSARFSRATNDRFFIHLDATDPKFREAEAIRLCDSLGGSAIEKIEDTDEPIRLPRMLVIAMTIATCVATIPPALAARSWFAKSEAPRIHIVQDMDNQERYKQQQASVIFLDGRADRPMINGVVARGDGKILGGNTHWYEGRIANQWAAEFPPMRGDGSPFVINDDLIARGQRRFNIYCAPCHGETGYGDGMVHRHVTRLIERGGTGTSAWVQPKSLHDPVVAATPIGNVFNTITNGIRTMPAYGGQINEADRWAIIAYVKTLERSQNIKLSDLTPEEQSRLQKQPMPAATQPTEKK